MDKKKVFQYSLLIFLIVASFLFYHQYFVEDLKNGMNNKSENVLEKKKSKTILNDTAENIIENLRYVSEDLLGNTYIVTAKSATLKKDRLNDLQLFNVSAEIANKDQESIYINSKTANYNKINSNTVFKTDVNVKYGDQTIDSNILNLNFKDNFIEILENVYYVNENTKIKADKVEIDLLYKKLKISMINKKDKVNIISKY